jgi:fructose-1,6-bisphosphatase I
MVQGPKVVTIERFIIEQERLRPEATGELSNLLYDIALAAKIISGYVRRAGLVDVMGAAGHTNVQGEQQQKLDVLANDVIKQSFRHTGRVCVMASEEEEDAIPTPAEYGPGKYTLLFDPLDGSSNIDVNVSIGTIFSVHRRITPNDGPGIMQDLLQPGRKQVAAGYIIYGSSTVLVYTLGHGVHFFTLDPTVGEFLLMNPSVETPETGAYYSVNESHYPWWSPGYRKVVATLKGVDGKGNGKNARYIGSLVADFHRNLVAGGIFLYPGDPKSPHGKLRLLYECAPLAFIAEQAGGAASDGVRPILDIAPTSLHQRTPLVIGSKGDVDLVHRTLKEAGEGGS